MQIPGLRGVPLKTVAKRSVQEFSSDKMTTYAAVLAYSALFALFPFLIFLIALLGFLQLSTFFDWVLQQAQAVVPRTAMGQVRGVIDDIRGQESGGLLSLGILLALWSASAGVRATMDALNVAYDVEETRPAWKLYPLSVLYTLGLATMIVGAAALMVLGPQVMGWLAGQVGLGSAFVTVWALLRWPVAVVLLVIAVALILYAAPNIDISFRLITPGSALAVIVWVLASLGFGLYVSNFSDYSATYGSLGAVIIMLLYFYISSLVLLFGAEVNAVIEHEVRLLEGGAAQGEPAPERDAEGERAPAERAVGGSPDRQG